MNRKLAVRILSFILCFLMTAGVLVFSNEKEASAAYTRYTTASVKVKAKADKNSTTLTKFSKGKKLTCYTLVDNYWYKIKYEDGNAYASNKYITINSPEQPITKTQGVINHDVYVRESNSPKAKKLGVLTKGTKVNLLEKTKNGWYKVEFKDKTGYFYGQYVDINNTVVNI